MASISSVSSVLLEKVKSVMDGTETTITSEHCSKISMMDENFAEDIYILILEYFLQKNTVNSSIPYNGKIASKEGKGLTFKVTHLPEELQKILVRYILLVSS